MGPDGTWPALPRNGLTCFFAHGTPWQRVRRPRACRADLLSTTAVSVHNGGTAQGVPGASIQAGWVTRAQIVLTTVLPLLCALAGTGATFASAPVSAGPGGVLPNAADAAALLDPAGTGEFDWPLVPVPTVLTPFEPPARPYGRGHRGVDLAGTPGRTVFAAGTGRVVAAGRLVDRGVVSIEHTSGLRTTYEPVTALVRPGDLVRRGQPIGVLEAGHPSCSPADCLHWGARSGEKYLNPLDLLAGHVRVRLLPWDG